MSISANNNSGFLGNIPIVTRNILIINVIIWFATYIFEARGIDLSRILGLHYWKAEGFHFYQIITYMFTHAGFTHLFFNMFAVFMFGSLLERVWGPKRYLTYYLVTGLGAALIQLLVIHFRIMQVAADLTPLQIQDVYNNGLAIWKSGRNFIGAADNLNLLVNTVIVGASGSVFGLLLAFGMLFPNAPLYIMFIPIPIKAKYLVIGYGLLELYSGFANHVGDNVAHFAHLGGMLFGIFMILYWKKKGIGSGTTYF
ncbi:rhomboid family intramembrane serine protease [Bacteroidales bacterium OttesenSCG-928-J19]|nr:rhomboid family intramembrane serine protease [Bacteroidales bacterium OttesenSCG-928-J19]